MRMIDVIVKKRDHHELTTDEIKYFVKGYTDGSIPDYQMSALTMAILLNGMTDRETFDMAQAMLKSGDELDLSDIHDIKVDKHSTGGVGDKISIPLAPLVASCGVKNPMISGRGLGHTGGTLDKLESIPGFSVDETEDQFKQQVKEVGTAIVSASKNVAPADKKIYALRDTTGTVESIPLIASSIMSKKLASGTDALVFDVKCGNGAFMKDKAHAEKLAKTLLAIGKQHGTKCVAVLTNMNQPLGRTVGNSLEVMESIDILKGKGPKDTTELTLTLGSHMLVLAHIAKNLADARKMLEAHIKDGSALAKLRAMIKAQGGNDRVIDDPSLLPLASHKYEIKAPKAGYITKINTNEIGMVSVYLGGGRLQKSDKVDPGVGLVINKHLGDQVQAGDSIVTVYSNQDYDQEIAQDILNSYQISAEPGPKEDLIYEVLQQN